MIALRRFLPRKVITLTTTPDRVRGTVRRYRGEYGFVTADDGRDLFVGGIVVRKAGLSRLWSGDVVEFSPAIARNGKPEAAEIIVVKRAGAA